MAAAAVAPTLALGQDARALFVQGAQAYNDGDYEEALGHFRASYEAREVPVVLFNIAQTLVSLERRAEAIDAFHRYLSTEEELDDARREAVEVTMRELEAQLAPVRVQVNVRGATVRAGERVLGQAPLGEIVYVDPGRTRFVAEAEGYRSAERELVLEAGRTANVTLRLEAVPREGRLRLRANVHPAMVYVDDQEVGRAPLEHVLPEGEHELRVEARGYADYLETIGIEDGARLDRRADLEPRDRLAHQWWLWAGIGGAVVIAAALALALTLSSDLPPLSGTLPTVRTP